MDGKEFEQRFRGITSEIERLRDYAVASDETWVDPLTDAFDILNATYAEHTEPKGAKTK